MMNKIKKIKHPLHDRLRINPTRLVFLSFAFLILFGAFLLNLPIASNDGKSIGFINALFTASSATSTTGLVVVDTYTRWTLFGKCVIFLLIQVGGLGFMIYAILFSLVLRRTITMKERLVMAEALNQEEMQGIVRLVKHLLIGTLMFEGVGAFILSIRFIPEFGFLNGIGRGIFHSASAFCNAGFDLMGMRGEFTSIACYSGDWCVNLTLILLGTIGGLGFVVWDDVFFNRRWSKLRLHTKVVLIMCAALILFGSLVIFVFEINNPKTLKGLGFSEQILATLFQAIMPLTAGFCSISIADMTQASLFAVIILMIIGGAPGSTAGGIKTTTLAVILLAVFSVVRGSEEVNLFGRRLPRQTILKSLVIITTALFTVVAGVMALLVLENFDFLSILYEVVSAFGTVGLSTGITPQLSGISKLILSFMMCVGRVGILTSALAILSRGKSGGSPIRYPEGKIMVG